MNYKTVLILLFVVISNFAVSVLLWQLDSFIHIDLYENGLIFSYEWAGRVWQNNLLCWAFVIGATILAVFAMAPHYMLSKQHKDNRFSVLTGFLLSSCALVFEGLSIFFLSQIDSVVKNALFDFGIPLSFDWSVTYEPLIGLAYTLMILSLVTLMIPTARSLGTFNIEIINE